MYEFTLVSTVWNDVEGAHTFIRDMEAQTLPPAEVVVTDAGSTDGTFEALTAWQHLAPFPVVVLQQERCNIAQGRNLAIETASHELIASTDFGCEFEPDWLEALMGPFSNPEVMVSATGFTVKEEQQTTPAARAAYVLSGGYPEPDPATFLPSSRSVAYRKSVWREVGGYEEWLSLAADDTLFAMILKRRGFQFSISPSPKVYWMRPTTYRGFGKEATTYGIGDGEAKINQRNFFVVTVQYVARRLLVIGLLIIITAHFIADLSLLWLLILLPGAVGFRPYLRAYRKVSEQPDKKLSFRSVLLAAFRLVEVTERGYIKGVRKGRNRGRHKSQGRAELAEKWTKPVVK